MICLLEDSGNVRIGWKAISRHSSGSPGLLYRNISVEEPFSPL